MGIAVFEPGSREEAAALQVLTVAKKNAENDGALVPTAFIFAGDALSIIPLLMPDQDWNDWRYRDVAAIGIKVLAQALKAHFLAIVTDMWVTKFENADAMKADGVDPADYKTFTDEQRARYPFTKREAISVMMEGRSGSKLVAQYYRRSKRGIAWEEIEILGADWQKEGRFQNLLPKVD